MGRIVWFGLIGAGAPASVVVIGAAAAIAVTFYLGRKSNEKKGG